MNKLLLLILLSASTFCHAQISAYSFTAATGTFTEVSGGTVVPALAADTVVSNPIPLGFDFLFSGTFYNKVVASSDGFLSFNIAATSIPANNLTSCDASLRPLLAPMWDDLAGRSGYSQFSYLTTGTQGNRIFTAEWKRWLWNRQAVFSSISFQVKLHEATNKIEYIYRPEPSSVTSGSASIGMAGVATGSGSFLSLSNLWRTPAFSFTTETTTSSTRPDSVQRYTFTPPPTPVMDLAISNISLRSGNICPVASLPISVTIVNSGGIPIDFSNTNAVVNMNLSGPVAQTVSTTLNSGTLAAGAEQLVNLLPMANFTANGTYSLRWSVLIAGDDNRGNDTLRTTTTIAASASPWAERFKTSTLPYGWKATNWSVNEYLGGDITGNPGNALAKRFASAADTGSFTTLSIGPVSATDRLSFDYKVFTTPFVYTLPTSGWGSFKVEISTDCSGTFTTIDSVGDAVAAEGWDFKSYSLAEYAGQYITLRIVPKWKTNTYILAFDNFKVKPAAAVDLATAGTRPVFTTCPNTNTPVQVLVRNDGTDQIDFATNNATLVSQITAGTASQTLSVPLSTGILAPGAAQWITVATNGNFAAANTYKFNSYITTAADGDRSNDTSINYVTSNTTITNTPWSEPFAATTSPTGWVSYGWNIGSTTGSTGNPGNYIYQGFTTPGSSGSFTTLPVFIAGNGNYLRFDYKVFNNYYPYTGAPAAGWGKLAVQVSPNCSGIFTTIDSITTTDISWTTRSIDLSAYSGKYVTIRMVATNATGSWNAAFDNFQITTPPAIDLSALQISVSTGTCPDPAASINLTVKQLGTATIDFAATPTTVTAKITGPNPQTITTTISSGTLAPLGSQVLTLTPGANLNTAGTYALKGYVDVPGDGNRTNDTATVNTTIANITTTTAPWAEPFTNTTLPAGWAAYGWAVGAYRGSVGNSGNCLYQTVTGNSANTISTLAVGPLPANSFMAFDYKITGTVSPYTPLTNGFGNIIVRISADCNTTIINLGTLTTADAGWTSKYFSMAAYAGKKVFINLIVNGIATPLDFAFDNFRFYTLPAADLSVDKLFVYDNDCATAYAPVMMTIKNNGPNTIRFANSNLLATLQVAGPIPQTLSATIAGDSITPGNTYPLFFNNANLLTPGTYQLKASLTALPDSNRVNDTLMLIKVNGTTTPWFEPFTDTVLSPVLVANGWRIGTTRGANGNPGNNMYYRFNGDSLKTVYTKAIGPIVSEHYLQFDYKVSNTAPPYDPPATGWGYLSVQISTNCGITFTTIDSILVADVGWKTRSYSLAPYAGQNIVVRFYPRWKTGSFDVAFDNLKVNNLAPCPAPNSGYTDQRTDSSARVNFTGSGSNFIIEYGPFGFTPGAGSTAGTGGVVVAATGSPLTVNGLSALTGFKFYVRQNCTAAGNGFSTNRLIDSFVTAAAPPLSMVNDLPANAIVLNLGAGCTGGRYTINGATQSSGEPAVSCSGTLTGGKIVWFKFAAPANGFVKVSTDAAGNTLTDTKAALFLATDSSNFNTFQILACDDDNGVINNNASIFYATGLVPGRYYYVAVDGFSASDTGRFCIQVSLVDSSMIVAAGSCVGGQQLPEHLPNYRGWLSATDHSGKLIANIRSNTTLPDKVTYYSFINVNTGSVRQAATSEYYLDRNFSIINNFPTTAGNWDVQFFFLNQELRALQAVAPTTTLLNVNVTRGKDSICQNAFLSGSADSLLMQFTSGIASGVSWVTVPTSRLANFYLNPGTSPLPRLYVFTGSGNWSNPANWSDNIVPPAMLPANCVIEIKPAPGGQCILDVNQRITSGDRLRIKSGTNVVIPGSVIIQ